MIYHNFAQISNHEDQKDIKNLYEIIWQYNDVWHYIPWLKKTNLDTKNLRSLKYDS